MKKLLVLFLSLNIFLFSNLSHAFFSKEVILNCEPKDLNYHSLTYEIIKYFRFDGTGESKYVEFAWSPTEKRFLKEENTILKVREEFYEIIVWDYFPETKAHRYRETFYIDRVTGTLRAQTDALIKQTNQILPYMSATYYNCKKIRKHQLPKKNIKKKF